MPVRELTPAEEKRLGKPSVRELTAEEFDRLSAEFNAEPPANPNAIAPGSQEAQLGSHPARPGSFFGVRPEVGPSSMPELSPAQALENTKALNEFQAEKILKERGFDIRGPWMDRPETQKALRRPLLTTAGMIATAPVAPFSWPAIAGSAAVQGGLGAAAQTADQMQSGGVNDPGAIASEAIGAGVGELAGGAIVKSAGALAKKIFSSPLDAEQKQVVDYAREKGLRAPFSSLAPFSGAGRTQRAASHMFLPARIQSMSDAKQVAVFLNQNVASLGRDDTVIKASAKQGQEFLRDVFSPGETAYTNAFKEYREVIGDDAMIPISSTKEAVKNAAKLLEERDESGALSQRLYRLAGFTDKKLVAKQEETSKALQAKIKEYRQKIKILDSGRTKENAESVDLKVEMWEDKIVEAKRRIADMPEIKDRMPDEMTSQQLDELYKGLLQMRGRDQTATGEMRAVLDAIEKDMGAHGERFGIDFVGQMKDVKKSRDKWRELTKIPGFERLSKDFGAGGMPNEYAWLDELFVNPNGKSLAKFKEINPEMYQDLADSWLGKEIKRASRPRQGSIGATINGDQLRRWYEANDARIKLIYGPKQAKALDNFTLYAKYMERAAEQSTKEMTPQEMAGRFLLEAGAATGSKFLPEMAASSSVLAAGPFIVIPSELSAFALARGLSRPDSTLFKAFTEGFPEKTRSFMLMSGGMAGRESGRKIQEEARGR